MKKTLILILMILFFSVLVSAKSVMITINGNFFAVADSDFSDMYGDKKYFPEGKIALKISGHFYLWGSYGFFSSSTAWKKWSHKEVEQADINIENIFNKRIVSGGLGYYVGYIERNEFAVRIEIGLCNISNDQETIHTQIASSTIIDTEEKKESGVGARGNLGVTYGIYKSFFAEVCVGYLYATDKVEDYTINLGGLRISLGLGFRF